jgi:hypothetical protein
MPGKPHADIGARRRKLADGRPARGIGIRGIAAGERGQRLVKVDGANTAIELLMRSCHRGR